jgi:uncharacterized membrane protein YraQ (UPF0718 family)
VPAASAKAVRHCTWASFKSPVQSTAQSTIGFPAPVSTNPIASSGSSTASTGLIHPPQSECPIGGVTSNRNGAIDRLSLFSVDSAASNASMPVNIGVATAAAVLWPQRSASTLWFVIDGLIEVAPLVVAGILVSAWVNASAAAGRIKAAFDGVRWRAILMASLIGAVTPVCGVTVLPLMAGMLAAGVPLAPVMAFWLSSPVTDPAMFSVTLATLGAQFAIAKTLFAFLLGVGGGYVTASPILQSWTTAPLRQGGVAAMLGKTSCSTPTDFDAAIWRQPERMRHFRAEILAMTKLIGICLTLAFAAEYLMQEFLQAETFAGMLGRQSNWAIPLAVFIGSPAYLDGYAALPLTRGLIEHGMSQGAAMAFLVSGSVVSIWGALAIAPVLRAKPFILYLALALFGSLAAGWIYDFYCAWQLPL